MLPELLDPRSLDARPLPLAIDLPVGHVQLARRREKGKRHALDLSKVAALLALRVDQFTRVACEVP
jgi:hypothetical protein